jgi:uncharacterized membrane protein YvlD (DUF360 family)
MVRTLIRLGLTLAGNALGIWLAALLLDGVSVSGTAFVIAVVIFTVLAAIIQPLVTKMAMKNAEALQGSSALITTFVALVLTALISDGLSIDGIGDWVLATVIVWLATMLAGVLLPMLFLKKATTES